MTEDGEPRGPIWVLFVIVIALGIAIVMDALVARSRRADERP